MLHLIDHSEDDDRCVSELVNEDLIGVTEFLRRRLGHLGQRGGPDGLAQATDIPLAKTNTNLPSISKPFVGY